MEAQRTAVVAEGIGTVGEAICRRLAVEGYKVVAIHSPQDTRLQRLQDAGIDGYAVDLSDYKACEAGVLKIISDVGRIDILVNNAGINPGFGDILDVSESVWDKLFDVNVKAGFLLTKLVVPHMIKNG